MAPNPPARVDTGESESLATVQVWVFRIAIVALVLLLLWLLFAFVVQPALVHNPPPAGAVNEQLRFEMPTVDHFGHSFTLAEVEQMRQDPAQAARVSPAGGAIVITPELIEQGRRAFYEETFGNEVYLTDILGLLDGPLRVENMTAAILNLGGGHTTNLRVAIAYDAMIGGRQFREGEVIDTGLDVPRGALVPLGMKVMVSEGRTKVGITCAACHSTVDADTGDVIHGAPNIDLNTGLMLALASNSAAYYTHAEVPSLEPFQTDPNRTIVGTDGQTHVLPDMVALEDAVDRVLMSWPPGNFDSMPDRVANPTQFPTSFTMGNHPYGWSGFSAIGPFRGLSVLNNNVHALNSDGLARSHLAQEMLEVDPELYIAINLLNAASPGYRWDPASEQRPSEFLRAVNPTRESLGVNHVIKLPTFPKGSLMTPDGLWISLDGFPVWHHVNAMSAFQNSLRPPPAPISATAEELRLGREVFERAKCHTCHSGPFGTNNEIIPLAEIGTQPSRASALQATLQVLEAPKIWALDTPVPVPEGSRVIEVPQDGVTERDTELAFGGDGEGGYKVMGLVGLYWSPPYLHDGGVAVGPNPQTDLGVPGTLLRAIPPSPVESLRALVDRELRAGVIAANEAHEGMRLSKVTGEGHEFWADEEAGFSRAEQDALIKHLLRFDPPADAGLQLRP